VRHQFQTTRKIRFSLSSKATFCDGIEHRNNNNIPSTNSIDLEEHPRAIFNEIDAIHLSREQKMALAALFGKARANHPLR